MRPSHLETLRSALAYLEASNPNVDPEAIWLILRESFRPSLTVTGYISRAQERGLAVHPEDDFTPERIKAMRTAFGFTQRTFASLLGYADVIRVAELESGKSRPAPAVVRLLKAFAAGYRPDDWPYPPRQQD